MNLHWVTFIKSMSTADRKELLEQAIKVRWEYETRYYLENIFSSLHNFINQLIWGSTAARDTFKKMDKYKEIKLDKKYTMEYSSKNLSSSMNYISKVLSKYSALINKKELLQTLERIKVNWGLLF